MNNNINTAIQTLLNNKIILYPTDTVYGIGCDATSEIAINKINKIKQRIITKNLIILVNDFKMLNNYVDTIPTEIVNFLKNTNQPTTVIYNEPKNIVKTLIAKDNTVAIRIVNKGFVYELIKKFGKPIVSTSANITGQKTPIHFNEISEEIKKKVDYIVNLPQENMTLKASTLIKFDKKKKFLILRE